MYAMSDDGLNVEERKIQLEREKFELEKARFEADEPKRHLEIAILRAQQEKAQREAEDLRVPYRQRPAYKTVVFQGIASVTAVVALLASALSIKPILDANKAAYEASLAKDEVNRANLALTVAEKTQDRANADKTTVEMALADLEK